MFLDIGDKIDRTLHEGEMAVWAVLSVIHLIPGYGN